MIGVKSIAIATLAATAAVLSVRSGALSIAHFEEITVASAFAIGLFASAAAALVAFGARPGKPSRAAVAMRGGRPVLLTEVEGRELPSIVQRALLVGMFACLALGTFTADATARIASVPEDLAEPSRAAYCLPAEDKPEEPTIVEPEPPPVDQAGCALVKRAYELGYAKTLGSCAPRAAKPVAVEPVKKAEEICDRRELDEPFLHYTWRRLVDTVADASPIDATSKRADEMATRVDYLRDLLADIKHSITGTPHGAHHVWITLPDPHPSSAVRDLFTGEEPCTSTFADLPLWPVWTEGSAPGAIVEHVIGQLLFATRFGTPASCSDYTFHWDAPKDACTKLVADPVAFLDEHDALATIRAVLDRRRRQAAIRKLSLELGSATALPEPPPAAHVASVACFVVGAPVAFAGKSIVVDGETLLVREASVPAVVGTGAGPIDLYAQLARLFAGATAPIAERAAEAPIADAEFPLASLEPLVAIDPFVDATQISKVGEVYPFDRHLHAFVESFRRVYFAQRGRL